MQRSFLVQIRDKWWTPFAPHKFLFIKHNSSNILRRGKKNVLCVHFPPDCLTLEDATVAVPKGKSALSSISEWINWAVDKQVVNYRCWHPEISWSQNSGQDKRLWLVSWFILFYFFLPAVVPHPCLRGGGSREVQVTGSEMWAAYGLSPALGPPVCVVLADGKVLRCSLSCSCWSAKTAQQKGTTPAVRSRNKVWENFVFSFLPPWNWHNVFLREDIWQGETIILVQPQV